jgi:arginyl-tRNA synthetase
VARLGLAIATQTVLAQALTLCGVSAPARMERAIPESNP